MSGLSSDLYNANALKRCAGHSALHMYIPLDNAQSVVGGVLAVVLRDVPAQPLERQLDLLQRGVDVTVVELDLQQKTACAVTITTVR